MVLGSTMWFALLALLGLTARPRSGPSEKTGFHPLARLCDDWREEDLAKCVYAQVCYECRLFCTCREGFHRKVKEVCIPNRYCPNGSSQSSCSGLQVTDGSVECSNNGDQTVCQVECDGQYQGEFTCTEGEGWTPELPTCAEPIEGFPPLAGRCDDWSYEELVQCAYFEVCYQCRVGCTCEAGFHKMYNDVCVPNNFCRSRSNQGSCSGLQVTDGSVECSNNGDQTVCTVECDGQYQGEFTCTEGEGWTPELPTCAEPIEDASNAEEVAPTCDLDKCRKHCQALGRIGNCARNRFCECY